MHSTVKFEDFINVLKEDYGQEMMPDVARDQAGLKSEYPAQSTSVRDLINKQYRSDVAPENMPYPLNEFERIASDAFISIQNLENLLKIAKTNEVIKNKKPLDSLSKELVELKKRVVDIIDKVYKIK
tara:strand:+ start:174 stop:554 length:381 start_codon:yes stop_codon:yes gene_type:complete